MRGYSITWQITWFLITQPIGHNVGGSVAVCVTGDRWNVTGDRWHVIGDMWQVTGDRWQVKGYRWHVLNNHTESVHVKEYFKCPRCGTVFSSFDFNNHIESVQWMIGALDLLSMGVTVKLGIGNFNRDRNRDRGVNRNLTRTRNSELGSKLNIWS